MIEAGLLGLGVTALAVILDGVDWAGVGQALGLLGGGYLAFLAFWLGVHWLTGLP